MNKENSFWAKKYKPTDKKKEKNGKSNSHKPEIHKRHYEHTNGRTNSLAVRES